MLLKFTSQGKFLLQIGRRDQTGGNKDTKNLKEPVGDGGNSRVVVVNRKTLEISASSSRKAA